MLWTAAKNASQELKGALFELSGTFSGAVAYVAKPDVSARFGLTPAFEADGLAVGLLSPAEGATHVAGWEAMLEQRVAFDALLGKDHLPIPLHTASVLVLFDRADHLGGQWMGLVRHRSVN